LDILEQLPTHVEALIFSSETPIRMEEILQTLEAHFQISFSKKQVQAAIEQLQQKYQTPDFAFELLNIAHGFMFYSKPKQQPLIGTLLKQRAKQRLSKASLETLAIIAYQQPVAKSHVEHIRGVNCDYALHKLLEKDLVEIKGRSTEVGRPLLYGTSTKFMQHFGLASIKDLPKLKEFAVAENEIGLSLEESLDEE
jgi:segregation and condensation protein B